MRSGRSRYGAQVPTTSEEQLDRCLQCAREQFKEHGYNRTLFRPRTQWYGERMYSTISALISMVGSSGRRRFYSIAMGNSAKQFRVGMF